MYFFHTILLGCWFRTEGKQAEILNYPIGRGRSFEILSLKSSKVNQWTEGIQTVFICPNSWFYIFWWVLCELKFMSFLFLLPIQRIPKGGRESSKVCTHWHFAVKLHTQNMHEKKHLEVILTQHSNLFSKEHKKTLSRDTLPGKDSIFLASAWKNANSQSSPCCSSL